MAGEISLVPDVSCGPTWSGRLAFERRGESPRTRVGRLEPTRPEGGPTHDRPTDEDLHGPYSPTPT